MITTIVGDDSFEIDKCLDSIRLKFTQEFGELSVNRFFLDDSDLVNLSDQIFGTSLFNKKSLYILSVIELSQTIIRFIENIIERGSEINDVILVFNNLNNKTVIAKMLKSKTNFLAFNIDRNFNITNWIKEYVEVNDGKIDSITIRFLIDNVSKDKLRLSKELDKLLLFNKSITVDSINLLSDLSLDSTIFNLIGDVFNNKPNKAIQIYRSLRVLNGEPAKILSTFSWALFNISLLKLSDKKVSALVNELNINPHTLNGFKRFTDKINRNQLKQITNNLLQIDLDSKSINGYDIDQAMEIYFLEIGTLL